MTRTKEAAWLELVDECYLNTLRIKSMSWAAGQLLLHCSDATIDDGDREEHVYHLVEVAEQLSDKIKERLDLLSVEIGLASHPARTAELKAALGVK